MKFSIKGFFGKCDQNRKFPADLVIFTAEILHGNFHFWAVVFRIFGQWYYKVIKFKEMKG